MCTYRTSLIAYDRHSKILEDINGVTNNFHYDTFTGMYLLFFLEIWVQIVLSQYLFEIICCVTAAAAAAAAAAAEMNPYFQTLNEFWKHELIFGPIWGSQC